MLGKKQVAPHFRTTIDEVAALLPFRQGCCYRYIFVFFLIDIPAGVGMLWDIWRKVD
jgi:hypothetical protein